MGIRRNGDDVYSGLEIRHDKEEDVVTVTVVVSDDAGYSEPMARATAVFDLPRFPSTSMTAISSLGGNDGLNTIETHMHADRKVRRSK